jgi:hypothetical protein
MNSLDEMGVKVVVFKMMQRVLSGQFDSRSFVGDIALELRSLLFKDESTLWREYDEWERKEEKKNPVKDLLDNIDDGIDLDKEGD